MRLFGFPAMLRRRRIMVRFLLLSPARETFEAGVLKRGLKPRPGPSVCSPPSPFSPSSPKTSRQNCSGLSLKGQDEPQRLSETITHSYSLSVRHMQFHWRGGRQHTFRLMATHPQIRPRFVLLTPGHSVACYKCKECQC